MLSSGCVLSSTSTVSARTAFSPLNCPPRDPSFSSSSFSFSHRTFNPLRLRYILIYSFLSFSLSSFFYAFISDPSLAITEFELSTNRKPAIEESQGFASVHMLLLILLLLLMSSGSLLFLLCLFSFLSRSAFTSSFIRMHNHGF